MLKMGVLNEKRCKREGSKGNRRFPLKLNSFYVSLQRDINIHFLN